MAKAAKVTKEELEAALSLVANADKEMLAEVRATVVEAKDALETAYTKLDGIVADQPETGGALTAARTNLQSWLGQVRSYRDSLAMMITSLDNSASAYNPPVAYAPPPPTPTV